MIHISYHLVYHGYLQSLVNENNYITHLKACFLLLLRRVPIPSIMRFNDVSKFRVELTLEDLCLSEQFIDSAGDVVQASTVPFKPFRR